MNEIVNFRGETNNVKAIRNGIAVKHNNLLDLSLYEEYGKVKKVPLHVLDGNTIDTQTGVYSTEIKGYYGLLNVKTDTVIQTKPVSETYKLVPHYNLFALQNENIKKQFAVKENPEIKLKKIEKILLKDFKTIFMRKAIL